MFSYRHAFHAGNHADVLKHTTLLALLRYLKLKDTPLTYVDTHSGAGLYRLDGRYAQTSGEAAQGVLALLQNLAEQNAKTDAFGPLTQDYLSLLARFNPASQAESRNNPTELSAQALAKHLKTYPGSPLFAEALLGAADKLKLHELHPSDAKALIGHVEQLPRFDAADPAQTPYPRDRIQTLFSDGLAGLKAALPPKSRRALVLIDPSYELKTDYAAVAAAMTDALKRFAQGVYAVWIPVIPRPEAHDLPKRLKTLSNQAGRSWLWATLKVAKAEGDTGFNESGIFVVNPPFTLIEQLRAELPAIAAALSPGLGAKHLESHWAVVGQSV